MLACSAGMTTWGFLLKKSQGLWGQCGTSSKIRSDTGQKHSAKADSLLEIRKAAAEPVKHKSGYAVQKERERRRSQRRRSSYELRTWSPLVHCSETEEEMVENWSRSMFSHSKLLVVVRMIVPMSISGNVSSIQVTHVRSVILYYRRIEALHSQFCQLLNV